MRLLLDELYPATIAVALRDKGYDVVAVQEDITLRGLSDPAVFEVAQGLRRALVTENVGHVMPLDAEVHTRGGSHYGLVLTSNRAYPRHRERFVGDLVQALAELLERSPQNTAASLVHWL